MAHEHMKEDKDYKVKHVDIRRADDGSFIYTAHCEREKQDNEIVGYKEYTYTFDKIDDIAKALEDDLMTPHPRKMSKDKSDLDKELDRKSNKKTAKKY